jgi:hypothetical protein
MNYSTTLLSPLALLTQAIEHNSLNWRDRQASTPIEMEEAILTIWLPIFHSKERFKTALEHLAIAYEAGPETHECYYLLNALEGIKE